MQVSQVQIHFPSHCGIAGHALALNYKNQVPIRSTYFLCLFFSSPVLFSVSPTGKPQSNKHTPFPPKALCLTSTIHQGPPWLSHQGSRLSHRSTSHFMWGWPPVVMAGHMVHGWALVGWPKITSAEKRTGGRPRWRERRERLQIHHKHPV